MDNREMFYREWIAADDDWMDALVRHYGPERARTERYVYDNSDQPAFLRALKAEFLTAGDKYRNACLEHWHNTHKA